MMQMFYIALVRVYYSYLVFVAVGEHVCTHASEKQPIASDEQCLLCLGDEDWPLLRGGLMKQEEQDPIPEWFATPEGRRCLLLYEEGLLCGICYTELTTPQEVADGFCQDCSPGLVQETSDTEEIYRGPDEDALPF